MSYVPCAGNETIKIADDSLAPIAGKGKISPCAGLSLHDVLHVPKISYNLLSISKITRDLNCKATFLHDSVSFQDLSSRRMIGTAWCHNRSPLNTIQAIVRHLFDPLNKSADQNPQVADKLNTRFSLPSRFWENILENLQEE